MWRNDELRNQLSGTLLGYNYDMVEDNTPNYSAQWKEHRIHQTRFYVGLIGGPILAIILSALFERAVNYLTIVTAIGIVATGVPYNRFPCPRCGERFCRREGGLHYRNPFAMNCLHCGLHKWTNHD
jgi:predicted RNA-binding Zn-ribbon protein involved in translation (DUF1610 family)